MVPYINIPTTISNVPFHSQLSEITSPKWQQQGCGITSLAMVIDYYKTEKISVNTLLGQGIAAGAFINNVGWSYAGLIKVSQKYGLDGNAFDMTTSTNAVAFKEFSAKLKTGPVIVSIHYKFDPKSKLPHLVVINGIDNGVVYYNDPAAKTGEKQISVADFQKGWKKRFIVIRPKQLAAVSTPKT